MSIKFNSSFVFSFFSKSQVSFFFYNMNICVYFLYNQIQVKKSKIFEKDIKRELAAEVRPVLY